MVDIEKVSYFGIGIIFHLIYIMSIFDIYYKSSIIHGMPQVSPPTPPAKRMIFFSGDGLRADKIFEDNMSKAPYLKNIVHNEGTFGISHTHVPTETRPCHLAMFGGVYEDVSAVTKGWKVTHVGFDTVFNQTKHSWGFGAPDLIEILNKSSESHAKFEGQSFPSRLEDFSSDGIESDLWDQQKVLDLFKSAETDEKINKELRQDKIIIFVHLNGLDTTGHAFLPNSENYARNINVVDSIIKKIVEVSNEFYNNDNGTAFILTGDHGMTDVGNHGDGNPQATKTPMIAWGAGVKKPIYKDMEGHDDYSKGWGFTEIQRNDIEQADIAPLIATLIGIPYPINSIGILPINYLGGDDEYVSKALFSNAEEIYQIYVKKTSLKKEKEFYYKYYMPEDYFENLIKDIKRDINNKNYQDSNEKSYELINKSLKGIRYNQSYDWRFLIITIILGYIGWILYSLSFTLNQYDYETKFLKKSSKRNHDKKINIISIVMVLFMYLFLFLKSSPINYYLYTVFPIMFWAQVFKEKNTVTLIYFIKNYFNKKNCVYVIIYLVALMLTVVSYIHRSVYTFGFILLGIFYPYTLEGIQTKKNMGKIWLWRLFCLISSVFALLKPNNKENITKLWLGGVLLIISGIYLTIKILKKQKIRKSFIFLIFIEIMNIIFCLLLITKSYHDIKKEKKISPMNSLIGWVLFIFSLFVPTLYVMFKRLSYRCNFMAIYLGYASALLILGLSYEIIFYFSFGITLYIWIDLENKVEKKKNKNNYNDYGKKGLMNYQESKQNSALFTEYRSLTPKDLKTSLLFLFFTNASFFCTGNIASFASFTLSSVYRLVTVFSPYLMAILLIIKILIPFSIPTLASGLICRITKLTLLSMFALTLSFFDIITINFFLKVHDEGSWLEIGLMISHFVICNCILLFSTLLYLFSSMVTRKVY